ncbi:lysophospholipid transporter LplT [Pantoea agglomerans]|nr:lysophospholipid transporter LplT [Pantoea agglomerans]
MRSFSTIMTAQFFSSLADNALFVVAVELLRNGGAPAWQGAALVPVFALFYVALAPVSGAVADAWPKGRVMFVSNTIKILGCVLMLAGVNPLISYAVVGLGAALYSPAKYGIITELLPASRLVRANGWIEVLTIISVILGVMAGGLLVSEPATNFYSAAGLLATADPYEGALASCLLITVVYSLAATVNLYIPRTGSSLQPLPANLRILISDFRACNRLLWQDKLGQMTLATTTLFWGVSGNLRYIVLTWAAIALGLSVTEASVLVGAVAIGTAFGALLASLKVELNQAPRFIPLGIVMGFLLLMLVLATEAWQAIVLLIALGGIGGYLLVSMNALLLHRGHHLMGAGRSIAVQNFNEQACILIVGLVYSAAAGGGLDIYAIISAFSITIMIAMFFIGIRFRHNLNQHTQEVIRQLKAARAGNKR